MNTELAIDFTRDAIKRKDLFVVELMAETHPKVVTEILEIDQSGLDLILESSSLVFQIKDYLNPEDRNLLLKKIVPKLMKHAEKIYNLINRSQFPRMIPYSPGTQWNVEKTIERFLLSGDRDFTYQHVICLQRKERLKNIILIIDKSHSVLVYLKLIILTSILFCMSTKLEDTAIITFDTKSELLKTFTNHTLKLNDVIHKISNLSSGGKTNIYSALKLANEELSKRITRKKTLVLISDLLPTSGPDFLPILRRIEDVRIILTPRRQTIQLTKPIIGELRRMPNVSLFTMPQKEYEITYMLEKVLYG